MKTQFFSKQDTPISLIGFLLLVTTTPIGCAILSNAYPIMSLPPVLLTQDDLPTMQLMKNRSEPTELSHIVECKQWWSEGQLTIYYYLFPSRSAAQKAALPLFPAKAIHRPEPNPKEVIGDATWRVKSGYIYFVKHNVLVHIIMEGDSSNQLQFVRDVARKIEAKIDVVLKKK